MGGARLPLTWVASCGRLARRVSKQASRKHAAVEHEGTTWGSGTLGTDGQRGTYVPERK